MPRDQRPVNELKALRASPLYDWACLPPSGLASRCASALAGVTLLLSAPIAAATFDPATELPQLALAASAGSLLVLLLLLVRTYLGWDHVGGRLLAAVVEYEETGWYDGQRFVKPPRVLARDRLLGAYEALPALARLRTALGATALALGLACASLGAVQSQAPAAVAERAAAEAQQQRAAGGGGAQPGGGGAGAGRGGGGGAAEAEEEEENTEGFELGGGPWGPSARLLYSDRAAEAERGAIEARLGPGVPAYCADRYARALAGDGVDCDALLAQGRAVRGAAAAAAAAAGGGGG